MLPAVFVFALSHAPSVPYPDSTHLVDNRGTEYPCYITVLHRRSPHGHKLEVGCRRCSWVQASRYGFIDLHLQPGSLQYLLHKHTF
ncbi:uncharacterized protein H6S33_012060 [Morchella sextelata]|uniref:uncharacterized protein n=1 Tax=Morchella sextelata TaxID=1174677 RepID=UPI001D053829|nr:uncharacterized protein H6S33_012060 [Morchella sextelata]KAH0610533.1 hypothetical protein H6S33_012060 [Morchella sextelata]